MRFRLRGGGVALSLCAALLVLLSGMAFGQGAATTMLSGTVVDSSGGVIPGADVVVKSNATGTEYRTVSDATGHYSVTGIAGGVYTMTVSLMGFKTVVLPDVTVVQGVSVSVKPVVLAVGNLTETVTVTGATELIQTESATVSTTLTTTQVARAPLPTRNTMDFVTMLPGREHNGRSALLHGHGPARQRAEHHHRRFEHPGPGAQGHDEQLVLLVHQSPPRRGRGSHGVDDEPGRRELRPGRRPDPVPDPLGDEPVQGQRVRLPAPHQVEHELLVQREPERSETAQRRGRC